MKANLFSTFCRGRTLKVKNLNWYVIWTIERLFFPSSIMKYIAPVIIKLVETTKTSLPCSPAVDQSVSWISRSNSVRLRIPLSRIPCTVNKSPLNYQFGVLDTKSLIRLIRLVVCILTHPTGSSKYGTTRKNTQRYYTTKRLIRYMLAPGPLISLDQ